MNPQLERALLLFQQSRFAMAETELRQALAQDPNDPMAHSLIALCLLERKSFQEATDEAQQGIHLAPDTSFSHYVLARVLDGRHHIAEARVAVTEAIRLDPIASDYHALLASLYYQDQRWPEALASAEQGLEHDPEHIGCTNLRAMIMVKLGRRAEAGATIDAALAKNPESSITHANQGWTLLEKGDAKRALEHFREALRLDPENEWARQGIIEALKARNFIYAIMLKYFLWMARFNKRTRWIIVIAGFIGNNVLASVAHQNPDLALWIRPVRILYVIFVLMTWLSYPLFNLLLRLNRFGRHALSREQTVASNWFGLCLALSLTGLIGWAATRHLDPWLTIAIIFGFLLLPVSIAFQCPEGWPRKTMAAFTIGLTVVGLANVAAAIFPHLITNADLDENLFTIFLIGAIASPWVSNFLIAQRVRR